MAKKPLNEDTVYKSDSKPKSSIINSSFINRLNSLFGFRTLSKSEKPETDIEKQWGIKFVRVDLNNDAYRVKNAALGSTFRSQKLNSTVEHYFDAYLEDNSVSYSDIQDRQARLNELSFMYYNDVFISRCCHLVADEATQIDKQDRIISIESPNANFVEHTYNLLNSWGITQARLNAVCFDLELYGESFWAHKIGTSGVEKIKPIPVNNIMERLEFSPIHVAKFLAERDGWIAANRNRGSKIKDLVDLLKSKTSLDEAENLADMFDDKLLGFELHDGVMAPPWLISHFRFNEDHSEFYPYGRPPLINCLAPFKQAHSTMALQGLARSMGFPVQLYKVQTPKSMPAAQQFEVVNNVRQQYDNLGVAPTGSGMEPYTVNTKIWMPAELLDIEVHSAQCDYDFIEDLENYQKRVAYAANIPLSYLDPNGGEGSTYVSGISLTEQYKPFARHVYSIQTVLLETLGRLIRMHYAITGEFDYNTPFILSMRFPAEEIPDDKRSAQSASIDLSQSIIDLLKAVLGIGDDDTLPEDVVTDILAKYSFLDATDIQKWMRLSAFLKPVPGSGEGDEGGGDEFGGDDLGGDLDIGGDEGGSDEGGGEEIPESVKRKISLEKKQVIREKKERMKEQLAVIRERYNNMSEDIYMRFIEQNRLTDWQNTNTHKHCFYVPKVTEGSTEYDTFEFLNKGRKGKKAKLQESEVESLMTGMRVNKPHKNGRNKIASASDKPKQMSFKEVIQNAAQASRALTASGVNINEELRKIQEDIKHI